MFFNSGVERKAEKKKKNGCQKPWVGSCYKLKNEANE
jgi:hypothetical protein